MYANPQLPLWWRVVLYAIDHNDVPLQQRQLRDAVDPEHLAQSAGISRAIRRGVTAGMLDEESTVYRLIFKAAA